LLFLEQARAPPISGLASGVLLISRPSSFLAHPNSAAAAMDLSLRLQSAAIAAAHRSVLRSFATATKGPRKAAAPRRKAAAPRRKAAAPPAVEPSPAATCPYGSQTIAEIYRPNVGFYSDKTRFIREIEALGTAARAVLALFPRRFGKTTFLDTVAEYYDVNNKKAAKFAALFSATDVGKNPTSLKSRFMVLRLNFSGIEATSFADFNIKFSEKVKKAIGTFCADYDFPLPMEEDGVALFETLWRAVKMKQKKRSELGVRTWSAPACVRSPIYASLACSFMCWWTSTTTLS
jgi:hypothetical protein